MKPRRYRFEIDAAELLGRLATRVERDADIDRMLGEWRLRSDAAQVNADTPLREVAQRFDLSNAEYDALMLALLVEVEPRLPRVISALDLPQRRPRPTLALALGLAADSYSDDVSPLEIVVHPIISACLIELDGDGPIPDRTIRVHEDVVRRLVSPSRSAPRIDGLAIHEPEQDLATRLVVPAETLDAAERWAHFPQLPLLLVGVRGSGRRSLVRAALAKSGIPLVSIDEKTDDATASQLARREARWQRAAILLEICDETRLRSAWGIASYAREIGTPFVLSVTPELAEAARASAPGMHVEIELRLSARERARVWRIQLSDHEVVGTDDLRRLATKYQFSPGRICKAVERTRALARLDRGDDAIRDVTEIEAACRTVGETTTHGLIRRLVPQYELSDLIAPELTLEELRLASTWIRRSHTVFEDWGIERGARGLTALLVGPPGTGKTMAAQVLAREVGLELLRIDISRLLSKYVGETEKNLAVLFDQARESGAILFFDEADAVFGKRTDTSDAQDRYSNLETAYLLQRLEDHEGVVILASNMRRNMDDAFARRLQFVIHFPLPTADLRLRLWQKLLPASVPREPSLDLRSVAEGFELSGGEIRNAILAAAFFAAEEGAPISTRHVQRGVARELRKKGAVVDLRKLSTLVTASA